jgi:chitin disaccharide deacetylase
MTKLYTRADDAGSSRTANRAIYECATKGIIRNISVMAPTPATEHAAKTLKDVDACFGFHFTLNAEWDGIKWKPLSPPELVPSLIDEQGYFLPHPKDLQHRFKIDEVLLEAKAQLEHLRALGFRVSYMDEHMGVGWIGLRDALLDFAKKENLVPVETLSYLPSVEPSDDLLKDLETRLNKDTTSKGLVYFTHPAFDDAELEPCFNHETPKGCVAKERSGELEFMCAPETKAFLEKHNVQVARFDEAS